MGGIAPVQPVIPGQNNSENNYSNAEREDYWRHVDNSVNAVSFGFVATAILISMFLLMAIFEKFLRSRSPSSSSSPSNTNNPHQQSNINRLDLEQQQQQIVCGHGKFNYPSPKMTVYAREVSVLMPGEKIPTFIANPTPQPCSRERMSKPFHEQQHTTLCLDTSTNLSLSQSL